MQTTDLTLLNQIGQVILRSTDLAQVTGEILELLAKTTGLDHAVVRLLNADATELEAVATYRPARPGELQDTSTLPPGTGASLARVLASRQPRIEADVRSAEGMGTMKRFGMHSAAIVPVCADDVIVGTLSVGTETRRDFTPDEVQLFEAVGSQIGLAAQKIKLYDEARRLTEEAVSRLEQLDVLYGVSQAILRSPDLSTVLEEVLDTALAVARMEIGSIRVFDEAGENITPLAHKGYSDPAPLYLRGRGIQNNPLKTLSEALKSGQSRVVKDVLEREGMAHFKSEGVRTAIVVPLKAGEQVTGMLYLGGRSAYEPPPRDVQLLEAIGAQVGLAIQKLRLHEATLEAYAELKRAETALREGEARYRAVVENIRDGVVITVDGKREFVNQAFLTIHGLTDSGEALGERAASFAVRETQERLRAQIAALERGDQQSAIVEVHILRPDGEVRVLEVSAVHIEFKARPACLALMRDVTRRQRLEAQIAYLADHDSLTQLLNRRRFEEELDRHLEDTSTQAPGGVLLYLDLDDFKEVNDILGHAAGDVVLRSLARLLQREVRDTDALARVGGDEFAVLMPGAGAARGESIARRIIEAIEHHRVPVQDQTVRLTACVGIALYPEHGNTRESLFVAADRAMYRAKEIGRSRYELYMPVHSPAGIGGLSRSYAIRDAFDEDRFFFEAQPILELKSGQISQYELLLRLTDAAGKKVPSAEFIGAAERFGLIGQVDRWVVRHAVEFLSELQDAGKDTVLEINLSARGLGDDQLLPLIQDLIKTSGVDPRLLIFEITENEAISDLVQARLFMDALRDLGCRFALDDFGVGFSSFNHLRHLPVDFLKIDGSFVRDLMRDAVDQQMVKAMVGAARALGIKTVAEWVENRRTLSMLRQLGVDYAQGFHVGRPQPVCELLSPLPLGEG